MKKLFYTLLATVALAFGAGAQAANPDLIVNTTGTSVRGLGVAVGVVPASLSASGTTQVLYENSTAWQSVQDDATGTKYQKIKAQLIAVGGIEVGTTGVIYVPSRAVETACDSGGSYIQLPNTASKRYDFMANDGCAYRDKVKANAN